MTKWVLVFVITGDVSGASRAVLDFFDEASCLEAAFTLNESREASAGPAGELSISVEARCIELPAVKGDNADELVLELRETPRADRDSQRQSLRPSPNDQLRIVDLESDARASPAGAAPPEVESDRD